FTHDGGEVIFNLPNGLQGYYLVNSSGLRLDDAPINIVSNPAASDPTVRNGISCIGCHTEGMKTFEDEVRTVIESTANPPYNKAQALRLYVQKSVMDARVSEDTETYRVALEATGGTFSGVEPVSRFHEAFHAPVDAAYAAAAVGLQTDTFLARIRENTGLQNVGLLALDNANGSVKRDTWTSSFRDIISALDYPDRVGEPPVITQPEVLPGGHVRIPDSNLRAAVSESLNKNPNAPFTVEEIEGLETLLVSNRGIRDVTGLQFATGLRRLDITGNLISDLSPIAGLINLEYLRLIGNNVSDLSPIAGLINLSYLNFIDNEVTDVSALTGLINLKELLTWDNLFSDVSPLARLTNLEKLDICGARLEDASLAPLAGLTGLKELYLVKNGISDISPLAKLTGLTRLDLRENHISNISPLAGLTNLTWLDVSRMEILSDISPLTTLSNLEWLSLRNCNISDISAFHRLTNLTFIDLAGNKIQDVSPLAMLSNLERLSLHNNNISDISALARLTNLTWLDVSENEISDLSPLDGLRPNLDFLSVSDNPYFPPGGPKILGPWLWLLLPGAKLPSGKDLLSEASGGALTELTVAARGATAGQSVGESTWTLDTLPHQEKYNISHMLNDTIRDGTIYGSLSLYSPREQATMIYAGSLNSVKVWLNGVLVHQTIDWRDPDDYTDAVPVTLKPGRNVLLVACAILAEDAYGFFGFTPGTEYTVGTGIGYGLSKKPIHVGDTIDLDIRAENVFDLAGWQFDLAFDHTVLEALDVREGDFLKTDGGATFFQSGSIDNAAGKITGLIAGRLSEGGVNGSGSLLQVRFKAKSQGDTKVALSNFLFGSANDESIPAGPLEIYFTVEERLLTGDVNRDGVVNILDLLRVARQLGQRVSADSPEDINGDGIVNIFDLTLVAQGIGGAAAPAVVTGHADAATVEAWIAEARLADDGSIAFRQGIANLQNLLASLTVPQETALHPNYPNPFNPETWIPYRLSEDANVQIRIYDTEGAIVRTLDLGHQPAAVYERREKAIHWNGRNNFGERVASGLYFYTLTAGDYTATRKMLILK
ncbi:MAG: leucine-rich repeat domain-containing protein, partial [Candidatus Poribacteria bacterium]|nr:leucine-rich repeat domain-containing protein [Candidatus Poribacteria bacterium]